MSEERNVVSDDAAADAVRDLAQAGQALADAHVALRDARDDRKRARALHAWRILNALGIVQGDTVWIRDDANLVVGKLVTARAHVQPPGLALAGRQQIGVKVGIQRSGPQNLIEHYMLWLPRGAGDLGWDIGLLERCRE